MEGYTYHDLSKHEHTTEIVVVEPGEPAVKLQFSIRTVRRGAGQT